MSRCPDPTDLLLAAADAMDLLGPPSVDANWVLLVRSTRAAEPDTWMLEHRADRRRRLCGPGVTAEYVERGGFMRAVPALAAEIATHVVPLALVLVAREGGIAIVSAGMQLATMGGDS